MAENTLQDKICLVTGSTSGIGKVTAREQANRGATVRKVRRRRLKSKRGLAINTWSCWSLI